MNMTCKFVPHICKCTPPGYAALSSRLRPLDTNIRVCVHTRISVLTRLQFCRVSRFPIVSSSFRDS